MFLQPMSNHLCLDPIASAFTDTLVQPRQVDVAQTGTEAARAFFAARLQQLFVNQLIADLDDFAPTATMLTEEHATTTPGMLGVRRSLLGDPHQIAF